MLPKSQAKVRNTPVGLPVSVRTYARCSAEIRIFVMPDHGADVTALVALHYQNEMLHADGKIRLGIAEGAPARKRLIDAAAALLRYCRSAGIPIIHVRIAFPPGHADLPLNVPIFR